jgi:hypothetical protein
MRTTLATLCLLLLLGGCERRSDRDTATQTATDTALDWRPAPPALPAGARAAVLEGDPGKPGPFRIRLEMPGGYEVRPHHHPMSEHIEVLEGTILLGRGKDWADDKLNPLAVGDKADVAPKEPHFVRAKERTVIGVRSAGPFEITYINPADDPRKAPIP